MKNQSLFITGTDTSVGKTTITAALLLSLQQQGQTLCICKPVETGITKEHPQDSDTERLRQLLSPPPSFESVCLYAFPQPFAPQAAARAKNTMIDFIHIHTHIQALTQTCSFLLIEGAGGIFTPLTSQQTMRDLITLLNIPCVIVGRTDLGGINHCLLTLEALLKNGISVRAIILNEPKLPSDNMVIQQQRESTVALIREWSSVPVFGPIGFTQTIEMNWQAGVTQVAEHPELQRLVMYLNETESDIA